jgi:hypothetical protein
LVYFEKIRWASKSHPWLPRDAEATALTPFGAEAKPKSLRLTRSPAW